MESEEMRPILNPKGPNKQDTEELIRALSTVLESYTWPDVKIYTGKMIKAIIKGYEIQSKKKYDGYLPEHYVQR